jgi:DNA-binding transcriptional MerR regulator
MEGETLGTADLLDDWLTYRKIDFWCRSGYIPGHEGMTGSGFPRRFSPDQVRRLHALARLTAAGFTLNAAALIDDRATPLGEVRLALLGPGLTLWIGDA